MAKLISMVLFFSFCPFFWASAEEHPFALAKGVTGSYEVRPGSGGHLILKVVQILKEEGQVKKLTLFFKYTLRVHFTLETCPSSGFGKHNVLELVQGEAVQGFWNEFFVFEDKTCLGPPASQTIIKDAALLSKASALANAIGEAFLEDPKEAPKKIGSVIFEALGLPTSPDCFVAGTTKVDWFSHQTRDGVLEKLVLDNGQLCWTIYNSTWSRGPATDKSGLQVHLLWKSRKGLGSSFSVFKKEGAIRTESSVICSFKKEALENLISISEMLLGRFRKTGNLPLESAMEKKVARQMALPLESYLIAD